jgi:TPR repeat protein
VLLALTACAHPAPPAPSATELYRRALGSNRETGAPLFEQACQAGEAKACARRALLDVPAPGGPGDWRTRAEPGLSKACAAGDADACELEAQLGGSPAAYERALEIYDARCAQKDAESCLRVGTLLDEGRAAPRDDARSLARMLRACELGLAGGCAAAGIRFLRGEGVPADPKRASELLQRAKLLSGPLDAGS